MAVSLKKALTAIALTLVLLASLFGWTMRIEAAMPQHFANVSTSHQIVLVRRAVCPPPPYDCG
jgi:hypothetical protein